VTPWFKSEGDLVVLLGRTREELGGSEYLKIVHGQVKGTPPWIDLRLERAVQQTCLKAIEKGLLRSAHDVSDGGLAIALAECCIAGPDKPVGARIELRDMVRGDALLFGESQSRIVVTVKAADLGRLQQIADKEAAPMQVLGEVGGAELSLQPFAQIAVEDAKSVWRQGLERRIKET
jgi:phosphoribosylformylglycinamidine synthase